MIERVRVAVVGVGNNTSALVQGLALYRQSGSLVGIRRPMIGGLGVGDIDVVAAFATSEEKIGRDLTEAIFLPPNNFPRLHCELPRAGVPVTKGLVDKTEVERVAAALAGAEVLLYSAPSGRPETARAYAEAARVAGVAFINTTSDPVARDRHVLSSFEVAGLPLLGDDLASQFGTSVVHNALLRLLAERGLTLVSSYQVNLGGTEDFRNLVENPNTKKQSKLNALTHGHPADQPATDQPAADGPAADGPAADRPAVGRVEVAPLGYLPHLRSQKVAHLNIEAQGWGETAVSLDLKLTVHDPSGAAGVNIDLIRIAASALRSGRGGYSAEATSLFKSPPGTAV
ncbi:inositol-3-phosphate synthase [Micromonospora lupini]|uniref:Inositol-3-phosphate synthase n=1 Tax=Micromonospora lupini str. Lupac 08 TaxID=1150864 RepID=I0L0F7_9ACTN|nr:inositol-3-phosphate synthase [Micromonospora lupini]CCH17304.1 Inositol-3-phosphate synthase [Micromonospora lupini str. Lupac 08]